LLLRRKGAPIPINDVWIAAHAMETGSMLITFDVHFRHVNGLLVWSGV
jgi:tRNA(fMet)-specific endonuclease VapC